MPSVLILGLGMLGALVVIGVVVRIPDLKLTAKRKSPGINVNMWLAIAGGSMSIGTASLLMGTVVSAKQATRTGWFVVAIVLFVIGALAFLYAIFGASLRHREEGMSPLQMEYDSADSQCHQMGPPHNGLQLRLRVRNIGRHGLNHVRTRLYLDGGHDHWLRIRHDNNRPNYERSQAGEILPADDAYWAYFDVAFSNRGSVTWIEYADEFLRTDSQSSAARRTFTVVVLATREDTGRSVVGLRQRFALDLLKNGSDAALVPIDDGVALSCPNC